MKQVICAVSDRAVGSYNRPFAAPTRAAAARAFTDEVNRSGSEMCNHPEDFELHHIADWEDTDGQFFKAGGELIIVRAKDVVKGDR